MRNYLLYYTSADGPGDDASWSVYVEEYASPNDAEPIEGLTRHCVTWPNAHLADESASRLQRWYQEIRSRDAARRAAS